ncbi:RIP metalloprotease RseP [Pseudanabaenaceae cyanobacterium LEGE 13415]|nr:RIP metalloprotease RseP [Pseudanabaenaceae cyanobacterium LEGE 13415]
MSVLAVILLLAVLIFVHELGHFLAARLQGIYANRFSIGFGPILFKYQGEQTEYALRALPLGGFVGFPDDDPDSTIPPDDPNLLKNRPVLDRAIVISAGVIANLIFAYFVLVAQLAFVGVPTVAYNPGVIVPQAIAQDVAAQAGIQDGDLIVAINGKSLGASEAAMNTLRQTIESSPGQSLQLSIERQGQPVTVNVTPKDDNGKGKIGVKLQPNFKVERKHPNNPIEVFTMAANEFQRIVVLTVQGFGQLISNFSNTANQVAGPVAIVATGAKIAQNDFASLFNFTALISINLAVINILPLPALDGGQLAFLLVEGIRGKPVPSGIQDGVMQTGLMLLLGLGVFLIIRDTVNLIPQ